MRTLLKFARDENGATAIEYGLIAGLVCVAIIASISTLGANISDTWMKIAANMPGK